MNDTDILTRLDPDLRKLGCVRCMGIGCKNEAEYTERLVQMAFYLCDSCAARFVACYQAMQEME